MKFFDADDFAALGNIAQAVANSANAKLERDGKVVEVELGFVGQVYNSNLFRSETKAKALLINIEPIETCVHPKEKIKVISKARQDVDGARISTWYECECGIEVEPKEFEEIK